MATFDINTTDVDVLNVFGAEAKGKTFLITGPSKNGIGAQAAISLASASPSLLILAGRDAAKISPICDEIKQVNPAVRVMIVQLDLASHESVRKVVESVEAITKTVDFLINNAGVMATRSFVLSEDSVESQFAINYLSHFLFTNLLLKKGVVSSSGVILNVGSIGYTMADINFEDINFQNGEKYNGWKGYGQAKSAQLLGTRGLANRLKGKDVAVLIAHPGGNLQHRPYT
ncbi:hypothetical protein BDV95DRAFT_507228 [Massariosphaeria phaeospora]|uniref:Short-chain dehydrogenase n=1 Tax=Massariosphaeria phaeospora TaxID=100035 RepID=A0A7C8HYT3_9PLEO|nr:hypothetical protein BDV95DRAFT_507228 [Massariosphaeria phaeospora]